MSVCTKSSCKLEGRHLRAMYDQEVNVMLNECQSFRDDEDEASKYGIREFKRLEV